ncbi:hypothetical protein CY0110_17907 [Crocosphaera chwakensis CCY0110]|uniref:Uncharacterized protein n=1 Tax=Crocosphaera chwakensis CCY0110 TaxID=391612 RepID=A3IIR3_9CHRO|nr:hypothetical protein CY0110_17907 [Crocosphaera chwakensis CCY0110]
MGIVIDLCFELIFCLSNGLFCNLLFQLRHHSFLLRGKISCCRFFETSNISFALFLNFSFKGFSSFGGSLANALGFFLSLS